MRLGLIARIFLFSIFFPPILHVNIEICFSNFLGTSYTRLFKVGIHYGQIVDVLWN